MWWDLVLVIYMYTIPTFVYMGVKACCYLYIVLQRESPHNKRAIQFYFRNYKMYCNFKYESWMKLKNIISNSTEKKCGPK